MVEIIRLQMKKQRRHISEGEKEYPVYFINLPINVVRILGWKKGDKILVNIDIDKGEIILKKYEEGGNGAK